VSKCADSRSSGTEDCQSYDTITVVPVSGLASQWLLPTALRQRSWSYIGWLVERTVGNSIANVEYLLAAKNHTRVGDCHLPWPDFFSIIHLHRSSTLTHCYRPTHQESLPYHHKQPANTTTPPPAIDMSSPKSTTATTSGAMPNISALHGAVGLARSRRHAASISSATTCCTDDHLALTKEDLPARDSLEIVRMTIAPKHERRNAATDSDDLTFLTKEDLPARDSLEIARKSIARKRERCAAAAAEGDDLPVLTKEDLPARDFLEIARKNFAHKRERYLATAAAMSAELSAASKAADVTNAAGTTTGSLYGTPRRNAIDLNRRNLVWFHHVPHRDSVDLARERAAARDVVAKRRGFRQRVCTGFRTKVGAALAKAKSGHSLEGSEAEDGTGVEGRPRIAVLRHTLRKLA
jgi:hypothetical protein